MSKQVLSVVACLLMTGLAFGQRWTQQVKISVPYEFVVGNTVLEAGTYWVRLASETSSVLMLTNTQTGASLLASNTNISGGIYNTNNEQTRLVFAMDASGRQVLHQIWIAGQSHGHDLMTQASLSEP